MKLRELLASLTAQNVQVILKDKDSGAEIVTLTSVGYASLEDTIEARKVESWRMVSSTKIEVVLGEILPDGGTTMKGIGFIDQNSGVTVTASTNITPFEDSKWVVADVTSAASSENLAGIFVIDENNHSVFLDTVKLPGQTYDHYYLCAPIMKGQAWGVSMGAGLTYSLTAYDMIYDET